MPTLILENVPVEMYERLRQRAAAGQRTLPEEMLHLLREVLQQEKNPSPRLPDYVPHEEISAFCDLPRFSKPEQVVAITGKERLPDPYEGNPRSENHDVWHAGFGRTPLPRRHPG